jgi:integrase
MPLRVHEVTPTVIDAWLDALKLARERSYRPTLRLSFEKELSLLATMLRFYDEYWDDKAFKVPIKKRHRENAQVVRRAGKKERGLSYADFLRVRDAILDSKYGEAVYVLMTLQFRQALRIGEAAALHWEDVTMDFKDPSNSSIRIRRHLDWARKRDCTSHIADGLKNSAAVGLSKESPMFPETFEALKRIFVVGGKGLVFKNDRGTFFEYRSLQHAYMLAFKRAGIEYGGTHNFRHGGCQLVYDRTGGDQALAGQLLGNEDSETVRVYARRSKTALKEAAQREWAAL